MCLYTVRAIPHFLASCLFVFVFWVCDPLQTKNLSSFSLNANYTTGTVRRTYSRADISKCSVLDERQPTLNLHDWHVFRFLMVISHLLSNLHWKLRLFLFCQLTALLKYATGQKGTEDDTDDLLPKECLAGEAAVATIVDMSHC